eukprot:10107789-Alexandrium_andersonii.AAC.1
MNLAAVGSGPRKSKLPRGLGAQLFERRSGFLESTASEILCASRSKERRCFRRRFIALPSLEGKGN